MQVKGVQATVEFDGATVTITKKEVGSPAVSRAIRVEEIAAVTHKPGTWLQHGYVQFLVAGSTAAPEQGGLLEGGRPPYSDMNSLSIRRKANDAAAKLVAAVKQASGGLSR